MSKSRKRSKKSVSSKSKRILELENEIFLLKEDFNILRSALCRNCKFINIEQTKAHIEQCNRAKLSFGLKSSVDDFASINTNLSSVARCISMPVKAMSTQNMLPLKNINKEENKSTTPTSKRKKSSKVTYPINKKPDDRYTSSVPVKKKKKPLSAISKDKSMITDKSEVLETDITSQLSSSFTDETSQFSIDESNIITYNNFDYSDDDDDDEDDGYIPDKYISSADVSEISEQSESSTNTFDLSLLIKQIRIVHNSINNNNKKTALSTLQLMEDEVCEALLVRGSKNNKKKQKYGRLLQLVQTKNIDSEQENSINENSTKVEETEIQIRVDQTSILTSHTQGNDLSTAIRSATTLDYLNENSQKNDKKKSLARCNSFHKTSNKDIIHQTSSKDLNQQRFLTFTVIDNGKKILKYGHILDILEYFVNTNTKSTNDLLTYLFTFRTSTTPLLLLNTLSVLYRFSNNPQRSKQVVNMITLWIKTFYVIDFHNNKVLADKLWDFIRNYMPSRYKSLQKLSSSAYNVHWDLIINEQHNITQILPGMVNILDENPRNIAEQMTIIEWEYFRNFNIFDCICDDKPSSPAISKIVEQFNRMTGWVAHTILSASRSRKRALYIQFFISVAKYLLELKNFNGIMEITGGLDSIAIGRLKKTWRVVRKNHFREYEQLKRLKSIMSPKDNFKDYRIIIKEVKTPYTPFFGVLSKDITLINVGNSTFINNLVNFEKCSYLWKVCYPLLQAQLTGYNNLNDLLLIKNFLIHFPIPDEQTLYDLSLEREPIISITQSK